MRKNREKTTASHCLTVDKFNLTRKIAEILEIILISYLTKKNPHHWISIRNNRIFVFFEVVTPIDPLSLTLNLSNCSFKSSFSAPPRKTRENVQVRLQFCTRGRRFWSCCSWRWSRPRPRLRRLLFGSAQVLFSWQLLPFKMHFSMQLQF